MGEYKNMRLIIYIFGIALGIELEPSSDLDQTTCKCKENEECNNNMICVCKSDFIPVHGVGCMLNPNLPKEKCNCGPNAQCNAAEKCVCKEGYKEEKAFKVHKYSIECVPETNTEHTDTEQFREKNGVENILNYFTVLFCVALFSY